MTPTEIALFQDVKIRKIIHNKEWFFSVVDVVGVLTDSSDPRKYWNKLAERLRNEGSEVVTKCHQLKLEALDGKKYATDCGNTETILRIIQAIPSPKAEPFKRWLAQVGYERIQEIENPELVVDRMRKTYLAKGYPEEWIEARLSSMRGRNELTNEWNLRGVTDSKEYAILSDEIYKAAFGKTNREYKEHKNLATKDNLRDHMTSLELAFTLLGELSTAAIEKTKNPKILKEHKDVARRGGEVAHGARKNLELQTGQKVVSKLNAKNNRNLLHEEN